MVALLALLSATGLAVDAEHGLAATSAFDLSRLQPETDDGARWRLRSVPAPEQEPDAVQLRWRVNKVKLRIAI